MWIRSALVGAIHARHEWPDLMVPVDLTPQALNRTLVSRTGLATIPSSPMVLSCGETTERPQSGHSTWIPHLSAGSTTERQLLGSLFPPPGVPCRRVHGMKGGGAWCGWSRDVVICPSKPARHTALLAGMPFASSDRPSLDLTRVPKPLSSYET